MGSLRPGRKPIQVSEPGGRFFYQSTDQLLLAFHRWVTCPGNGDGLLTLLRRFAGFAAALVDLEFVDAVAHKTAHYAFLSQQWLLL
jgi:hypothetical protein